MAAIPATRLAAVGLSVVDRGAETELEPHSPCLRREIEPAQDDLPGMGFLGGDVLGARSSTR